MSTTLSAARVSVLVMSGALAACGSSGGATDASSQDDGDASREASTHTDASTSDAARDGTVVDAKGKDTGTGATDAIGADAPASSDGGTASTKDSGVDGVALVKDGATPDASDAATCAEGVSCGDGGICAHGECCAAESACNGTCCSGAGLLCVAGACVHSGVTCFDSNDCAAGSYCQYEVNAVATLAAGAAAACIASTPSRGTCLPLPSVCPNDAGATDGGSCVTSCQVHNKAGNVSPSLKYSWGGVVTNTPNDVIMQPIVLPLEDTNCDGKIDGNDVPDIVFTSFAKGSANYNGTLQAVSVRGGQLTTRWSVPSPVMVSGIPYNIDPETELAGANLDPSPGSEIVACLIPLVDGGNPILIGGPAVVGVFHPDGTLAWSVPVDLCRMPEIADLNQDGVPEVVVESGIINSSTYALTHFTTESGTAISNIGYFTLADVDGDGTVDVVTASAAYHANGVRFVYTGIGGAYVSVGDLDKDGKPEVVASSGYGTHSISIWHYETGATPQTSFAYVQKNLDVVVVPSAGDYTGVEVGTATIADFNGDGTPDVAVAGGVAYTVFDGKKLLGLNVGLAGTDGGNAGELFLWELYPTVVNNSATGSTAFDLLGGGTLAAFHTDQQELRILNGPDGGVDYQACNSGNTLWQSPVIADIDGDGHADIITVANAYNAGNTLYACHVAGEPPSESGIQVFSDPNLAWVRTRAIWNEYGYHVTNVNDDGTIPVAEPANGSLPYLDTYRVNRQPAYESAAADAVVSLGPSCSGGVLTLTATVRNIGEAELPAEVEVDFFGGSPASKLASTVTPVALYAGQSIALPIHGLSVAAGPYYAVVNPTPAAHAWQECRTDNNTSATVVTTSICSGM